MYKRSWYCLPIGTSRPEKFFVNNRPNLKFVYSDRLILYPLDKYVFLFIRFYLKSCHIFKNTYFFINK